MRGRGKLTLTLDALKLCRMKLMARLTLTLPNITKYCLHKSWLFIYQVFKRWSKHFTDL